MLVMYLMVGRSVRVWCIVFFFFKQKTAYEMRISDWSSDVCSSDLRFNASSGRCAGARKTPRIHRNRRVLLWRRSIRTGESRSEERRVGKSVSVRVVLGGRRIITKKKQNYKIHNISISTVIIVD